MDNRDEPPDGYLVPQVLRQLLGSVVRDHDLFEDCAQDARIALWRARHKLSGLHGEARIRYAATCVRNAARRQLRSYAGDPSPMSVSQVGEPVWGGESLDGSIAGWLDAELVVIALHDLTPGDQSILRLAFWQNLSDG
jgi:DNA-directed RNA polymerase specialized sigma24 family protein